MARVAEETIERGRSRIAENTAALTVIGGVQMVFTLLQLGILSRHLGAQRFGLYVVLRGLSLLLSTIMLVGLPQVLVRFIPSFQRRGRSGSAIVWFLAFSSVTVLLGAAVLASVSLWSGLMPDRMLSSDLSGGSLEFMILASITLAMKMVLYGGFNGLREMRVQMIFELSYQLLFTLLVLIWRSRLDVPFLFASQFALNGAAWIAGLPVFTSLVRRTFQSAGGGGGGGVVLPSAAGYWSSALLLSYAALAFTDVDRFVMSSMLPVAAISVYHVASRINQLLKRFLGFPVVALQPELTRIYEEGRWEELSGKIGLFTRVSVFASMAVVSVAAGAGGVLILLVSGSAYSGAYRLLLILLPTVPAAALTAPLTAAMRGLHFIRWAVVCDIVWMAVYFTGLFVILPRVGLVGTAAAQLAASAAQASAAVALARREGIYAGSGGRPMLGAVAILCAFGAAGAAAGAAWGLPAAAACFVLAPFVVRLTSRGLSLFDRRDAGSIAGMMKGRPGTKVLRWVFSWEIR
jgi:O-antigen/teichoic acid export membrane protein